LKSPRSVALDISGQGTRRRRADLLLEILLFIGAAAVLAAWLRKALFLGQRTLAHDHLFWGLPTYSFYADGALNGRLPLWNPFTHCGEPFYPALLQLRLLDPVTPLMLFIGRAFTSDLFTLYAWDRFIRGLFLAVGIYALLRPQARHRATRIALLMLVLWSSVQWASFRQMALADQFLFAPWIALLFLRIVHARDQRWGIWILAAVAFGLNFQSYFFSGVTLLLLFLAVGYATCYRRRARRFLRSPEVLSRAAVALVILMLMALPNIALYLSSKDLLPTVRVLTRQPFTFTATDGENLRTSELLRTLSPQGGSSEFEPRPSAAVSHRWTLSYSIVYLTGSFSSMSDYLQMLAPLAGNHATAHEHFWGRPSEAFLYLGQIPYAVALLGLVAGRGRLKRMWLLILAVFFFLSLGPDGGVHAALYWILPPLWFIRHTQDFSLFVALALLYFFVLGAEHLLAPRGRPLFRAHERGGPVSLGGLRPELVRPIAGTSLTLLLAAVWLITAHLQFPFSLYQAVLIPGALIVAATLRRAAGEAWLFWALLLGQVLAVIFLSTRHHDWDSMWLGAIFLVVPVLVWLAWTRHGTIRTTCIAAGVVLSLASIAAYVGPGVVEYIRHSHGARSLAVGLAAALGLILLSLSASPEIRRRLLITKSSLTGAFAVLVALDLLVFSSYAKQLADWQRPDQFLGVPATPQTPHFPATRGVAPIYPPLPPGQTQMVRYLDVLERRAYAFTPVPQDEAPASDLALSTDDKIRRMLETRRRLATFFMPRQYFTLITSGIDPSALKAIAGIGRPLIAFKNRYEQMPDDDTLRLFRGARGSDNLVAWLDRSVAISQTPGAHELEPLESPSNERTGAPKATWTVQRYDYNSLVLSIVAPRASLLYWADGYDPAWRAFLDGAEIPVQRANINFKAVRVPPGSHDLRWVYRPTGFLLAVVLYYVPIVLAVSWSVIRLAISNRRRPTRLPTPRAS